MRAELWGVDAFTAVPFRGNPAAVCCLAKSADATWMQQVAAEINLSETAFLVSRVDGWALRWFTPTVEVALCGHATLASAHFLWESARIPWNQPVKFHTDRSGVLTCQRASDWIEMDFPTRPATPASVPPGLADALGVEPVWVGRSEYDYLCELPNETAVRELRPDHAALSRLPVRGVVVTAPGSAGFDCVSRFFAPGSGVAEDPVTGSAHCSLGPFWSARLGRTELRGWQASARGGEVRMRLANSRIWLQGQAVTVWKGELRE
ncbi:MAG TPA: PhzF family phenazine biosynthesis protein [Verrucomicrobiota bacterium]|nr:oxidoreductase [Verrucomicrobiales bacterium]HRI16129.1 PhzF family phenazine biosynthesis protein [Verrucomicrobiota bacterium]